MKMLKITEGVTAAR